MLDEEENWSKHLHVNAKRRLRRKHIKALKDTENYSENDATNLSIEHMKISEDKYMHIKDFKSKWKITISIYNDAIDSALRYALKAMMEYKRQKYIIDKQKLKREKKIME